jgi:large subunit ribosomal protein L17
MRHGNKVNHLSRTYSHRAALLKNLSKALIEHKHIVTTLAKAKELRKHVEPLLTKSKMDNTHSRRVVFGYLQDKRAVKELFTVIAPKISDRNGGYLRILKLGPRQGDATEMAFVELVDFNEFGYNTEKKTRRRRTRRGSGAATQSQPLPTTIAAPDAAISGESVESAVETTVILETGSKESGEIKNNEA